jgi:hypothetical protein
MTEWSRKSKKKKSGGGTAILVAGLVVLALLLVGGAGAGAAFYFYNKDDKTIPSAGTRSTGGAADGIGLPNPAPSIPESPRLTKEAWSQYNPFASTTLQKVQATFGPGTKCTVQDLENSLAPRLKREEAASLKAARDSRMQSWYVWKNGEITLFCGVDGRGVVKVQFHTEGPRDNPATGWKID